MGCPAKIGRQIPSSLLPQVGCERLTRSPTRSPIFLGEIPWTLPEARAASPSPGRIAADAEILGGVGSKGVSLFRVSYVCQRLAMPTPT